MARLRILNEQIRKTEEQLAVKTVETGKMNGLINVLKPPGLTSHEVVEAVLRRMFDIKRIGHTEHWILVQRVFFLSVCRGRYLSG